MEEQRVAKIGDLVAAFNELTERMGEMATAVSSQILFKSLKLAFPLLQSLPTAADGRSPLSRALAVAYLLADLQMDAEVVSAAILREAMLASAITMEEVESQVGAGTAHLLQESLRMKNMAPIDENLDDESASKLRKQCLSSYDIRALILEIAVRFDLMHHLDHLPKYHQQKLALEALKIYAPLAHAIGAATWSLELEDVSFRYTFPSSYQFLDTWLRTREADSRPLIEIYKEKLHQALKADAEMAETVDDIFIKGRYKSRFSTMKKLLKAGLNPEEVHDILGLRVILDPKRMDDLSTEKGRKACYKAQEKIQNLWKEVPEKRKDYIAMPKEGYSSLHLVIDLRHEHGTNVIPMMEIQIRTTEMDMLAECSHSLYKGGLAAPEAERLKEIMLAAAEVTALHLKQLPSVKQGPKLEIDSRSRIFRLIDENGDGRISMEELRAVMKELGHGGKDAEDLMQLLDENNDGFLSVDEFNLLQNQVGFMRNMEDTDDQYRAILSEKLETADHTGLIHVYRRELSDKLAEN